MLVIKRTRPGAAPYWVLPGGHTDETDNSLEDALRRSARNAAPSCAWDNGRRSSGPGRRELREELGGDATILRLVDVIHRETERQYFYLATMDRWSFAGRTGPEFSEPGRGTYELEEIPSHADHVEAIDLKPDEIAEFLTNALRGTGGLAALPDLREMGWAR